MKQQELISEIVNLLIQSSIEVRDKGKVNLYDINVISEDTLAPILSIIFGVSLCNLNEDKDNYPGIDLASTDHATYGDTKKRIAFQITSTAGIEKIKKTLKIYKEKEFYKDFGEIFIYNIDEKQNGFQPKSVKMVNDIVAGVFEFDLKKHVIDRTDLEKRIKGLRPVAKIVKIHKLLTDQYVYQKKSLFSLEIWKSGDKVGYGFSNLISGIDQTTFETLSKQDLPKQARDVLASLFESYNKEFSANYGRNNDGKFPNLGFNTYLKAAFAQTESSYALIRDHVPTQLTTVEFSKNMANTLEQLRATIDESDFPLINNPSGHPAVLLVKTAAINILSAAGAKIEIRQQFAKSYNEQIPSAVTAAFGNDEYESHLKETKDKWIRENEIKFLVDQKNLAALGFAKNEDLQYQQTFGTWEDIRNYNQTHEGDQSSYNPFSENTARQQLDIREKNLKPIEELIDEYFQVSSRERDGFLRNILFLIADFGKGKTSFLHHYAASYAQQYLKTKEGPFPVYLNLNEYDRYSNSPTLGVIANFLAMEYKIDIKDDYFKKKEYIFLLDSLDESGELSESHIEKVVSDIIQIQNLDNINQRNNRIIIASRPISKGLSEQIKRYCPHPLLKQGDQDSSLLESTDNYISFYGFKQHQFDGYIEYALKKLMAQTGQSSKDFTGNPKRILKAIEDNQPIRLHSALHDHILEDSELRKPIFAYMIYKLISMDTDFINLGKVSVYVSFLNQLTREAKHKDDYNYRPKLEEEYTYRNILHASAVLWQYKRQNGEQISLTKADICRTIEGKQIDTDDRIVLTQFQDIESIHFLSHSYLGEKENTLHFQHQSFAEILLAEYYLKVFIKHAIEDSIDVEEARIRLNIGIPTDQTIDFLKGLITMLRECVEGSSENPSIIAKRELLIPLMASIAINKHNKKLYSTRLKIQWFEKYESEIYRNNKLIPEMIRNFPITLTVLQKIEELCREIIKSPTIYTLGEPRMNTVLFNAELSGSPRKHFYTAIDKWFALIIGNLICNNISSRKFFNNKINSEILFQLIRDWNFEHGKVPEWGRNLFMGILTSYEDPTIMLQRLDLTEINFSFSTFSAIYIRDSMLRYTNFSHCNFTYFSAQNCDILRATFDEIKISESAYEIEDIEFDGPFSLIFSYFDQGVVFPNKLNYRLKGSDVGLVNHGPETCMIDNDGNLIRSFVPLKGIFKHLMKIGTDAEYILSAFSFRVSPYLKKNRSKGEKNLKSELKEFLLKIEHEVEFERNEKE
ncbi:SMEK domain-containing protein [Pedobacter sp. GSP4]|uniref:SMEK domain-containing protein n=1 Tax=Pedobacter sp. GSP4 TaxID=3453716 RepID=UPI003EEBA85C